MAEPCTRCGDPDGHLEDGTAAERNCALFRIGSKLDYLNELMERVVSALEGLERKDFHA